MAVGTGSALQNEFPVFPVFPAVVFDAPGWICFAQRRAARNFR
jgi:hypothetical protein